MSCRSDLLSWSYKCDEYNRCIKGMMVEAGEGRRQGNGAHGELNVSPMARPYRMGHLVVQLGWVDLDLGCSTILLGQ